MLFPLPLRAFRVARHGSYRKFATTSVRCKGPFKVLFCGSDEFSVGSLRAVLEAKDVWESIHVITPSERFIGRGGHKAKKEDKVYKPVLMTFAEEHELPYSTMDYLTVVRRPSKVFRKKAEAVPTFKASDDWTPPPPFDTFGPSHLLLTASFGHIIPNNLLANFDPAHRLNVHPSLLPRWRGAAPIQWTIANGDTTTGVSVQRLVEKGKGIDAGDIVGLVDGMDVPLNATYQGLLPILTETGGKLLVDVLRKIMAGDELGIKQDPAAVTRAPKIGKETAHIKWLEQSAGKLEALHRGISHQYPLWTELHGQNIQLIDPIAIEPASVPSALINAAESRSLDHRPGTAWLDLSATGQGRRLIVACVPAGIDHWDHLKVQGHSWLEVRQLKPEGKRVMPVRDWWNGLGKMERKRNWVQFKGRRFLDGTEEEGDE